MLAFSSIRGYLPLALGLGLGIAGGRLGYRAAHLTRLMIMGLPATLSPPV